MGSLAKAGTNMMVSNSLASPEYQSSKLPTPQNQTHQYQHNANPSQIPESPYYQSQNQMIPPGSSGSHHQKGASHY